MFKYCVSVGSIQILLNVGSVGPIMLNAACIQVEEWGLYSTYSSTSDKGHPNVKDTI